MSSRATRLFFIILAAFPLYAQDVQRRLTRYEYSCTVRDLLGVDFSSGLPADVSSNGFDNNAATLTVTPTLVSKYLAAARKIARAAVEPVAPPASPELSRHSNASAMRDITWRRNFKWEGDYDVRLAIAGRKDPFTVSLSLDGEEPRQLAISSDSGGPRSAELRLHVSAGPHDLRVFVRGDDPGPSPINPAPAPYPEYIELRGPYGPALPTIPAGYRLVYTCGHAPGQHTPACLRANLANLARRAWRRPASEDEIDKLIALTTEEETGGDRDSQAVLQNEMEMGIEAILVSPSFLFRTETSGPSGLDNWQLASRLSYFLWSSTPDSELFETAAKGQLTNPAVLAREARRMLADARSNALADNFAAQWLEIRNLDSAHRDRSRFPEFTSDLRNAMREETELFVLYVLRQERSVLDFLEGKYTFLNEPLARLYGMPGIEGDRFRKANLTNSPRTGILTQASIMTVTSYATRTSPVLRGKWVLDNILNEPPPPPPANVPALRDPASEPGLSLRQQLEEHRSNPVCSACHARMDVLGFGLENFDAIGRWRVAQQGHAIDAKGTLPDGSSFSNTAELAAILGRNPEAFARVITEKLMTYALGRGLTDRDRAAAEQIAESAARRNYRFADLVTGVVESPVFRTVEATHE